MIAALITLSFLIYGIVLIKHFWNILTDKFASGGKKETMIQVRTHSVIYGLQQLSLITATCTLAFTLLALINIIITIVISLANQSTVTRYLLWTIPFIELISCICLHIFPMLFLLFFFGIDMRKHGDAKKMQHRPSIVETRPASQKKKKNAFMNFEETTAPVENIELKDTEEPDAAPNAHQI